MRSLGQLLSTARELTPLYIGIIVTSVLTAATALLMPFIISAATDTVVAATQGDRDVRKVIWLAVALLAADLANTLLTNIGGYWGDVMAARLRAILSNRYYAKLMTLPQRYFDNELTGTIISRLTRSITETTQFLNMFANNFFPMLLTTLAVLVIAGWYSIWLAVLLIVVFPTFMWLTTLTSKRWQAIEGEKNANVDIAGGRFAEVIGQIRVVRSFVAEPRELRLFRDRYADTVALTRTQSRYWHSMDAARRGALNVIFFGVYAIIFVRTVQGAFTVGQMVLLIQLVNMARQPVMMMSFLVDAGQRAIAGSRDFFAVMALEPDRPGMAEELAAQVDAVDTTAGATAVTTTEDGAPAENAGAGSDGIRGTVLAESAALAVDGDARPDGAPEVPLIEFDHATFGYEDGPDVLKDVSFTVRRGERIAFVGESGGGKTTIVSLLLGFYRLRGGHIRILGQDIETLSPQQLRQAIGVVFQDPSLFSGTIAENIGYARPQADRMAVESAAEKANASSFIAGFPDGYDTVIGERGLKLSGGQKQRVSIARAMLKDAPILVLDEATSALDTKAERLVQAGLDTLMEGRTTLIIAHRLSTISSVDRIVTLRDGRVDEIGSPDELATSGGIYAELLLLQSSSSKKDRKRLQAFDIMR